MRFPLLVFLTIAASLCAQARHAAFVRVLGSDGRPAVGAKVTCVGPPGPFEVEATADVIEVETDARGRAQPRLLAQRRYTAFAHAPRADGGHELGVSWAGVTSGRECRLLLQQERLPTRVVVEGQEAWRERGPLRCFLLPRECVGFAPPLLGAALPPLPAGSVIEVRDREGEPLWSSTGPSALVVRDGGDLLAATLPPPQSLGVRVLDSSSQPVADAVLWQAIERTSLHRRTHLWELQPLPAWRPLGRTGEDGRCTVSLAVGVRDGRVTDDLCIEARRDGYASGRAGTIANQSAFANGVAITPADGVLPITLAAPEPIRVHPPTTYSMVVRGVTRGATARSGQEGPVVVQTGVDGKAQLPLARDLTASRLAWIRAGDGPPGLSVVEPEPQGSFVMAPLRELRVHVTDALGGPARGQVVTVGAWTRDWFGCDVPMLADPAGKLPLRVGRGTWFVWCQDGSSVAWRMIEDGTDDVDVALAMQPLPTASLRLVDAKNRARAGLALNVSCGVDWNSLKPSVENRILLLRQVLLLSDKTRDAVTDAEGILAFPVLPLPAARLRVSFYRGVDARGQMIRHEVVLVCAGETIDVVLP